MVIVKMPERIKLSFNRYIGIDYSGAETPDSSLKGLRLYKASRESLPVEVEPPPSPRKYWTRRGLAEWLAERLSEDVPTIVGIDHVSSVSTTAFPFPCGISRFTTWNRTGRSFWMTFRSTGRPMPNTPMSISSGAGTSGEKNASFDMNCRPMTASMISHFTSITYMEN
jgi:hypothetical protein